MHFHCHEFSLQAMSETFPTIGLRCCLAAQIAENRTLYQLDDIISYLSIVPNSVVRRSHGCIRQFLVAEY